MSQRTRAAGRDAVFRARPVIRRGERELHLYHEEWQPDGGRGKLGANHAVELYNIATDPGERKNLASAHHDKREELLTALPT